MNSKFDVLPTFIYNKIGNFLWENISKSGYMKIALYVKWQISNGYFGVWIYICLIINKKNSNGLNMK
jgi:hypothetical protein